MPSKSASTMDAVQLPNPAVPPPNENCPLMGLPTELRQMIFAQAVPDCCTLSRRVAAAIDAMPAGPFARFLAVQAFHRANGNMHAVEKTEYTNFRGRFYMLNGKIRAGMSRVEHAWLRHRFPPDLAEFAAYVQNPHRVAVLSLAVFAQDFIRHPPPPYRNAVRALVQATPLNAYEALSDYVNEWVRLLGRLPRGGQIGAVEVVALEPIYCRAAGGEWDRAVREGPGFWWVERMRTVAAAVPKLKGHRFKANSFYTPGGRNRESWALDPPVGSSDLEAR